MVNYLSFMEIIDIFLMTFGIGFIFIDIYRQLYPTKYQNIHIVTKAGFAGFNFKEILMSGLMVAPGIILHEMGHKFVAIALGIQAVFHAAYIWLFAGILIKLSGFPFIFFVPGYVSHTTTTYGQNALISIAGPAMNFILWGLASLFLMYINKNHANKKLMKKYHKWIPFLLLTKRINMFLFVFNMLPIPPFDGYHFFHSLYYLILG